MAAIISEAASAVSIAEFIDLNIPFEYDEDVLDFFDNEPIPQVYADTDDGVPIPMPTDLVVDSECCHYFSKPNYQGAR